MGDTLLLWFHHVGWRDRLPTGRTLWQELVRHYSAGVDSVRANLRTWEGLAGRIDEPRFQRARANLVKEEKEARWWRDASLLYWQTFSKLPIPAGYEQPAHTLDFYESLRCPSDPVHASCPPITGPDAQAQVSAPGATSH